MIPFSGRILVVDDFAEWRGFVRSTIQALPGLRLAAEASDGIEAVQKAQELQPDLIILDIGLPKMNGIEAAREIHERVPNAKILFFSETRSWEIVEEVLRIGAGLVVKANARAELLPAVVAVLQGQRFVSSAFNERIRDTNDSRVPESREDLKLVAPLAPQKLQIRHEVQFYADDAALVDGFARLIQSALRVGNVAVAVATESHRRDILSHLNAADIDVDAAIEQGRYIPLDIADTLSACMHNGNPDPVRCAKLLSDLLARTVKQQQRLHARVAICGEGAAALLAEGNLEAAIRLEHVWDEIMVTADADMLCGYIWKTFPRENGSIFQRVCAEHSAIHGRVLAY